MRSLVLYGRPGCHLCDVARATVLAVRDEVPFALQERNIEADDDLLRAYLERIPVLTMDGRELFDLHVDADELRRALREGSAQAII